MEEGLGQCIVDCRHHCRNLLGIIFHPPSFFTPRKLVLAANAKLGKSEKATGELKASNQALTATNAALLDWREKAEFKIDAFNFMAGLTNVGFEEKFSAFLKRFEETDLLARDASARLPKDRVISPEAYERILNLFKMAGRDPVASKYSFQINHAFTDLESTQLANQIGKLASSAGFQTEIKGAVWSTPLVGFYIESKTNLPSIMERAIGQLCRELSAPIKYFAHTNLTPMSIRISVGFNPKPPL